LRERGHNKIIPLWASSQAFPLSIPWLFSLSIFCHNNTILHSLKLPHTNPNVLGEIIERKNMILLFKFRRLINRQNFAYYTLKFKWDILSFEQHMSIAFNTHQIAPRLTNMHNCWYMKMLFCSNEHVISFEQYQVTHLLRVELCCVSPKSHNCWHVKMVFHSNVMLYRSNAIAQYLILAIRLLAHALNRRVAPCPVRMDYPPLEHDVFLFEFS